VFVQGNAQVIPAAEVEALLANDELYAMQQRSPGSFPRSVRAYLGDCARRGPGWLHPYYPDVSQRKP
jgi:hypothetical protein